jgi:hypothetical protein
LGLFVKGLISFEAVALVLVVVAVEAVAPVLKAVELEQRLSLVQLLVFLLLPVFQRGFFISLAPTLIGLPS